MVGGKALDSTISPHNQLDSLEYTEHVAKSVEPIGDLS